MLTPEYCAVHNNCSASCLQSSPVTVCGGSVDLLPPRMKLQIFVDMPWRVRLKTCVAPLTGKSPQQVMTPAVADPTYLGYARLYRMMLDLVSTQKYFGMHRAAFRKLPTAKVPLCCCWS